MAKKNKQKKRKKKSSKLERHHIVPSSRGGTLLKENIKYVRSREHGLYHDLFENKRPDEIIDYLVTDFWNNQSEWVEIYLNNYKNEKNRS